MFFVVKIIYKKGACKRGGGLVSGKYKIRRRDVYKVLRKNGGGGRAFVPFLKNYSKKNKKKNKNYLKKNERKNKN